jgi:curved DNA-binding protein CbpA
MSHITIDFDTLKYNLYEVLGIDNFASETKIKKAFRNLILNFHPDKNNNIEEEIYFHIVTANQILTNNNNRKKYDDYLNKLQDTHDEIKNKFNKIIKKNLESKNKVLQSKDKALQSKDTLLQSKDTVLQSKDTLLQSKEEALEIFNNKFSKLEKNHLINFNNNNDKTIDAYSKLLKDREKNIEINKEDIKSPEDFNTKFENRVVNGNFNDQLIPSTEKMELSTINVNDNYTSLDIAFDNLYIEGGGINTSKFSSLDSAFKIQSFNTKEFNQINIKDAMNIYKDETNKLSKINYSKDRFDTW